MNTYLTRQETAAYIERKGLPCSKQTLAKWATIGGGPIYRRFGNRVVYKPDDVDKWIEEKLSPPVS